MEMSKGNPKCPRKPKIPKCAAWGVREAPGVGREVMQPPNPFCPLSAACTRSGALSLINYTLIAPHEQPVLLLCLTAQWQEEVGFFFFASANQDFSCGCWHWIVLSMSCDIPGGSFLEPGLCPGTSGIC